MIAEDGGHVVVGLAGVDDCGLADLARDARAGPRRPPAGPASASGRSDSRAPSRRPRRPVGSRRRSRRAGFCFRAPGRRVVGVYAGRHGQPGVGAGESEGAPGRLGRFADHDDPGDAAGPRPGQHLVPIGIVRRVGEMAVGVDEHRLERQLSADGAVLSGRRRLTAAGAGFGAGAATDGRAPRDRASASRWP